MPADPLPDPLRDRADRLVASRRWTRSDLDLLRVLLAGDGAARAGLLAGDPGRERSLTSLVKLGLAAEADGMVRLDAEARAVAEAVLAWHAARQARAAVGPSAEGRRRGEDLKRTLAEAVRGVFPRIPDEVAQAAAARLAPAAAKMGGRLAAQSMVDAVVAIRMERWRQAVAAEPEVAERVRAMQMRGDAHRAVKRFKDQRAVERVEAEIADWRGGLEPVTSRRLG